GTESKMKLWDVLATCLLLLSSAVARPLYRHTQPAKRTSFPGSSTSSSQLNVFLPYLPDDNTGPYPEQFEDVMDFIEATIGRLRRSSESRGAPRGQREQRQRGATNTGGESKGHGDRRKGRGRGGTRGGKGVQTRGCLLKEVHLNVTDLGLGYQTKEELIFRYCSGPCAEAETNYDKILNNLTHNKKLDKDAPSRTCCRPIAFDDDLSFLDDNVVYHTLKKHSARKCGCV
uniref:Glial cell line-derived neurotrophic factor n=1 Tax=Tetraodon nigroviridis TaxID=99883 RepID=H3CUI1_TETNG